MTDHRVVSLIASATEIVSALGFEESLVGRSHECDFPPSVEQLPACSEPKIDVEGSSRQIDDRVKAVLRDATSVYRVHADVLDQLEPTVIVTQTQCEVCAVSLKDVEAAVCELVRSQPAIVSLEPNCLVDVWNDFRLVADALGEPERGERLIAELKARLNRVADDVAKLPPGSAERANQPLRIGCIEWVDPLMAAGNWVPELVEMVGAVDVFGKAGEHSDWMTWDQLLAGDPDVIAFMPCGFGIIRTREELPVLLNDPRWQQLRAVRNSRVYVTDGNQFFNRPGPRLVESAEILAELLYPGQCDYGHAGSGWEVL